MEFIGKILRGWFDCAVVLSTDPQRCVSEGINLVEFLLSAHNIVTWRESMLTIGDLECGSRPPVVLDISIWEYPPNIHRRQFILLPSNKPPICLVELKAIFTFLEDRDFEEYTLVISRRLGSVHIRVSITDLSNTDLGQPFTEVVVMNEKIASLRLFL